ncbi:MAG: Polyphosphate kinase, partial [uncultured Solirubrobacteraceae bacterium]
GLRPLHVRPGDRQRRRGPLQLPHGVRAPAGLPQGPRRPDAPARGRPGRDQGDRGRPRGRAARADPHEDELARGPQVHPRALPRLPGGRPDRAQPARHLLPRPRGRGRQRDDRRVLRGRALPRALADLRLRARGRDVRLPRLGRPHAAQPRHPRRAPDQGGGRRPARRPRRRARPLPGRRHERVGPAARPHVGAPHPGSRRAAQRPPRAHARPRGAREGAGDRGV